MPFLNAL